VAGPSPRRAQIVEATQRILNREGVQGASLRAIARELGLTTGSVTHHFKDKEELLVAAVDATFTPFDELLAQALAEADTWEGLRRLCVAPLPTTPAKRAWPRLYANVLLSVDEEPVVAALYRKRYDAFRHNLRKLLLKGQRNGSLRRDFDARVQCDLLCALVDGLSLHATGEPERFTAKRLETLVVGEVEKLRALAG
jgi:AcrR family transcriptional regulator